MITRLFIRPFPVFCLITLMVVTSNAWGPTGHRIVGEIAQKHLTAKAAEKVRTLLKGYELADVANWADEMRSEKKYKELGHFHYTDIPDGHQYNTFEHDSRGDVVNAIHELYTFLKTGSNEGLQKLSGLEKITQSEALKLLVHFVGDIHQPLHGGGHANDAGGTHFFVDFMSKKNKVHLHSVWDSDIIDHEKLSFTEYSRYLDHTSAENIKKWENMNVEEWANEDVVLRDQIYEFPDKEKGGIPLISYIYIYKNKPVIEKRLLQAGIRLSYMLNSL